MPDPQAPFRRRYLPVEDLLPGMVLARPLTSSVGGFLEEQLSAGCVLGEAILAKLSFGHADCACILEPETRTPAEVSARRADEERRLADLFVGVDLGRSPVRALHQALLDLRCSR